MDLPIYLDHAATTPVAADVLEQMLPFFGQAFANPATLYGFGMQAREAVDTARQAIADCIGANAEEVYFTSGGTEADNWALRGALRAAGARRHVLVSAVEHHAVLDTAYSLRREGYDVEVLPVDADGVLELPHAADRIRDDTAIVSLMHANNEVGAVEPVEAVGRLCRERGALFHVDAVQSFGKIPVNVGAIGCDLLSVSAHKIYGPKGVGALYVRRGVRIESLLEGGGQEKGRRAGTLNVPGIVGFGGAARRAESVRSLESPRLAALRDRLMQAIENGIPDALICGPRDGLQRLPNNVHCCLKGVEGEPVLLALDATGVCASAGSACTAGSPEPSHVLRAMGIPVEEARGALRLTLGESTTREAVDYTAARLVEIVAELRALSNRA